MATREANVLSLQTWIPLGLSIRSRDSTALCCDGTAGRPWRRWWKCKRKHWLNSSLFQTLLLEPCVGGGRKEQYLGCKAAWFKWKPTSVSVCVDLCDILLNFGCVGGAALFPSKRGRNVLPVCSTIYLWLSYLRTSKVFALVVGCGCVCVDSEFCWNREIDRNLLLICFCLLF